MLYPFCLFTPIRLKSGRPAPVLLKGGYPYEVAELQPECPLMVTNFYSREWRGDDFEYSVCEVVIEKLPGFDTFKPTKEQPFFDYLGAAFSVFAASVANVTSEALDIVLDIDSTIMDSADDDDDDELFY